MRRVVLDTDMGSDVDDALCLALALVSPEIELVALTNVGIQSSMEMMSLEIWPGLIVPGQLTAMGTRKPPNPKAQ